jgi:hypothetical protein
MKPFLTDQKRLFSLLIAHNGRPIPNDAAQANSPYTASAPHPYSLLHKET